MDSSQLIEEIRQISEQYHAEVGRGRKAWPNSIKDRVTELFESGMRAKAISQATGLAYYTVLNWRPGGRKGAPRGLHARRFKELAVVKSSREIARVTVPKNLPSVHKQELSSKKISTVTVTTPDGYQVRIDGLREAADFLRAMRGL